MSINLQIRDLAYFMKIAELGHLGRAAEVLHVSQSALSKCIDRLEDAYGAELFERVGRGIRLTSAGQLLCERSQKVERLLDETRRQTASMGKGLAGVIRVGAAATTAEFVLPKACRLLQEQAPAVLLEIQIGMNDVLHDSLRKGALDLVVGPLGTRDEELSELAILNDEVVVVASANHPLAGRHVPMQALCEYRWILSPTSVATRQWLEAAFSANGLPAPDVAIVSSSLASMRNLIAETGLLSFVSRRNLASTGDVLIEIPNEKTTMPRRFGVIHRTDAYLSPATRRFIDILQQQGDA
ncbi:LysR family transcriptional regulator [Pseudomonas sp. WJP1]|uniref:LysR family transcriptional regulator n=1 Tax=Pseudomonas sp. WJP1 TaxID=2986947 RepID=UPI0023494D66|nr:LysR family transcriptional regulator [Pseudomonas sp. WJP1]WCM53190.1 LysR family transcriptional regulator [Pseudomonas sp. WJP1]